MENISQLFKALSDEKRLEIFELIRREETECDKDCCDIAEKGSCICDIAEKVGLCQATVSHHIKELRYAKLIKTEKRGTWVYCRINNDALAEMQDFLQSKRKEKPS
jgi:ArsR family transcriptional regulator